MILKYKKLFPDIVTDKLMMLQFLNMNKIVNIILILFIIWWKIKSLSINHQMTLHVCTTAPGNCWYSHFALMNLNINFTGNILILLINLDRYWYLFKVLKNLEKYWQFMTFLINWDIYLHILLTVLRNL